MGEYSTRVKQYIENDASITFGGTAAAHPHFTRLEQTLSFLQNTCSSRTTIPLHHLSTIPQSARILDTYANKPVLGLKLLGSLQGVVDQGEPCRFATTKGGLEAENENDLLLHLVNLGQLLTELIPGHVGTRRVQNVDDHLLPLQEPVGQELTGADGDCC